MQLLIKGINLFVFIFLPIFTFSQSRNDCELSNIQYWQKAFIKGGEFSCSDWSMVMNETFDDADTFENNWQTFWGDQPTAEDHRVGRSFGFCDENLWLDENVEIKNGQCIIHGKHEPGSEWTNGEGSTFVRDFTTGVIMTEKSFQLGYFETTIADMPGKGWHASFWLWHHEEIDIMERFHGPYKYNYNSLTVIDCDDISIAQIDELPQNPNPISLYDGPHKPAADLTPFKITFYYNDIKLPHVVYRFFNLNGTPLDIDCGNEIQEGEYYINPNFPKLYRKKVDENGNFLRLEAKYFKPIIDMDVLPKYGLKCCPDLGLNVYCDDPECNLECSNWGNPIRDGMVRPGYESNTEMVIDNVIVKNRTYTACDALLVFLEDVVCESQETTIFVEDLGSQSITYTVDNLSVTSSSNIQVISIIKNEIVILGLASGPGSIEISYTDKCKKSNSLSYPINVLSESLGQCSKDQDKPLFDLYPNPALSEAAIYLSGLDEEIQYHLDILDVNGKVHYKTHIKAYKKIQLPYLRLAKGLYFLRLETDGNLITKKLIIM